MSMKTKIFMLIMAAVIFAALPASAYSTRITLKIEPHGGNENESKVSEDLIAEDGTYSGEVVDAGKFMDERGYSVTNTRTEFRNIHGELMLSTKVSITALSEDFTVKSGEKFAGTLSVDAVLELYDSDYDMYIYIYSLDVADLPEWLKVSGDIQSNDAISFGRSEYHHEFVIEGTPDRVYDIADVILVASIKVSGDYPVLLAESMKYLNISVVNEPVTPAPPEPEPEPQPTPDVSPDISPDVSPDVPVSPDVSPDRPPYVPPGPEPPPNFPDYLSINGGQQPSTFAEAVKYMTPEEKEAIITLKIGRNITSLEGLEGFINLKNLDLTEARQLDSVDLHGNLSITSINMSGNVAIVSVNVRGCENLEVLDVSSCGIEDINVEGCYSLSVLHCQNNNLHRLDVYMLVSLNELLCHNQMISGVTLGSVFSFEDFFGSISASSVRTSDSGIENILNVRAWDFDGNEITAEYDSATGIVYFGGNPAKMTYDYITGFEDVNMDVTVFADETRDTTDSGSSGGCEMFSVFMMIGALILILYRKRY